MVLWNCCTPYARKFGKLSSGHRTGKCQFSFQSQWKAMPKNVQTTAQLHSSLTLAKWCSKVFNWTLTIREPRNPDVQAEFKEAEEPGIKLPTSLGSSKKQESSTKTYISALLTRCCKRASEGRHTETILTEN